jgi:NitT/TauT family transport system substrate-binding protein
MRWRMTWFAVSFLIAVSSFKLPGADARIVVGVSTVNVAFLPIYLTQDKGFFKGEGLDVLVVMFNAGATNLQALIGGNVQIMAGGVPETVLARARDVDAGITAGIEQEIGTGRLKGKVTLNELIDYGFINTLGKK